MNKNKIPVCRYSGSAAGILFLFYGNKMFNQVEKCGIILYHWDKYALLDVAYGVLCGLSTFGQAE